MRKIGLLPLLLIVLCANAQVNIIPAPATVKQPRIMASFSITPATQIVLEGSGLEKIAAFFNDYLQRFYLFKLKVVNNSGSSNTIRLNYERMDNEIEGSYTMKVNNKGVYIAGDNANGVFYGIQSLIQLLPIQNHPAKGGTKIKNLQIPHLTITDHPRFAYRGLHLDVGRHFMPVDFVKRYIDYIALHKMNYFHWHLTEDQGWRIEIKKYPRLTEVGAWRNGTIIGRYPGTGNDGKKYGGFYTQEQVKEIVQYAAERYITVVPEIEMPGHGIAAIAAYPQLSCFPDVPTIKYFPKQSTWAGDSTGKQVMQSWGVFDDVFCAGKEETFNFLQDVIDEILPLFPSQYIHIGGDECPKANWKKCPRCQQRMKDNNLKDEHELQSYFIQRMEKYINSKGRTLVGWDEILEGGLAPKAIVMSWRGEDGGIAAAKENHEVIMTPTTYAYLDYSQTENEDSVTIGGFIPLEKVYNYEPIPVALTAEQGKYVLGAQGNVWTEYMKSGKKVEYMIFPRLSALSEVLWTQKEKKNWNDFEKRMMAQFKWYDLWKADYSKAYFDLKVSVIPAPDNNGVLWIASHKYPHPAMIRFDLRNRLTEAKKSIPAYNINDLSKSRYVTVDTIERELKNVIANADTILIKKQGDYLSTLYKLKIHEFKMVVDSKYPVMSLMQKFRFNKATGKKITLKEDPAQNYPGDGAFTLVNGVQNEKGRGRSKEFLGFNGKDCEAVIDLGSLQTISSVTVHCFKQEGAWIWRPLTVEVFGSADGQNFTTLGLTDDFTEIKNGNGTMRVSFEKTSAKFVKVMVKNWGEIPQGEPGAGNKPWLFVDEIEIN